jgi:hypothetical protein
MTQDGIPFPAELVRAIDVYRDAINSNDAKRIDACALNVELCADSFATLPERAHHVIKACHTAAEQVQIDAAALKEANARGVDEPGHECWDDTHTLDFTEDDGGRVLSRLPPGVHTLRCISA